MQAGIPKESQAGETRVAAVPESVRKLCAAACQLAIVSGERRHQSRRPLRRLHPGYGMPIPKVSKARHIFLVKRSIQHGYSGVVKLLFQCTNCTLVFGDARSVCEKMANELKLAA